MQKIKNKANSYLAKNIKIIANNIIQILFDK